MQLVLDNLLIQLSSPDEVINQAWMAMSRGWPYRDISSDKKVIKKPGLNKRDYYKIQFDVQIVENLPPLPVENALTVSRHYAPGHRPEGLAVYQQAGQLILRFARGGVLTIPVESGEIQALVTAVIQRNVAEQGYLEDVTFTGLAPVLRRRGYYLVHAFAAAKEGRAILLVGPSGSGKTTTGLNLVINGWEYLANDVVIIQRRPGGVYALPTPGGIGISPETGNLIPRLRSIMGSMSNGTRRTKHQLSVQDIADGWAEPARIEAIYFPTVKEATECSLRTNSQSLTLARLLENSVDRWDSECLEDHFMLLHQLSRQACGYDLELGEQLSQLMELISVT